MESLRCPSAFVLALLVTGDLACGGRTEPAVRKGPSSSAADPSSSSDPVLPAASVAVLELPRIGDVFAVGEEAGGSATPSADADSATAPLHPKDEATSSVGPKELTERPIALSFADGPVYFTPAFDGSQRFSLWLEVMRFARAEAKMRGGTAPHFTFFVNACYYATKPGHSEIGRAHTQAEVLIRRALTQEAINEGHDIGSHGVGHEDGRDWTVDAWRAEFDKWNELMTPALFAPIRDADGGFVFPRFEPVASASPGEVGARCATNTDCTSGQCIDVTERDSFCTTACNLKIPCPEGTHCGSPMFLTDTDVCLPTPAFPIEHEGQTLFFANGTPNFKHPALKPYRVEGYRVPFLASNDALYKILVEQGYEYDTSLASSPKAPYALSPPGESHAVVEFPLMPHPGARTIPMDYNYRLLHVTPERMRADYESSLLSAESLGHIPWNVGHHFATWDEGAYLKVLEETVRFALDGCPEPTTHEARCPKAEVVSFRDLLDVLKARGGVPASFRAAPKKPASASPVTAQGIVGTGARRTAR